MITEPEIIVMLRAECVKSGSIKAWAVAHDLSDSFVGEVLSGRRKPSDTIAQKLGYERKIMFAIRESAG
jgi:hypothetical protein